MTIAPTLTAKLRWTLGLFYFQRLRVGDETMTTDYLTRAELIELYPLIPRSRPRYAKLDQTPELSRAAIFDLQSSRVVAGCR